MRVLIVAVALLAVAVATARAEVEGDPALGAPGILPGQLLNPTGVTRGFDGNIYVANTANDRIEVFARDGAALRPIGGPGAGPGQLSRPSSVHGLAAESALLVLDAGNDRVQKLSLTGRPSPGFSGPSGTGDLPGSFDAPQDITADFDGRFWVADTGNDRVQAFAADGTYLETIGEDLLSRPRGVALGSDGTLYVSDSGHNQIVAYPPGVPRDGPGVPVVVGGALPGQVLDPGGIAVDGLGRLVVADSANARIERFTADGTYLDSYAGAGSAPMQRPEGVFVTPRGDLLVAAAAASVIVRATETLPPPIAGRSANIARTSGRVFVRLPNARAAEPLGQPRRIPVGTRIDARGGAAQLLSARSTRRGDTQTGNFFDGRFTFRQPIRPRVVTTLVLTGGSFASCPPSLRSETPARAGAAARKRRKKRRRRARPNGREIRRLWGRSRGPTRTAGRDAAATDKGTEWLTADYCNGTLVRVKQGVVSVRARAGGARPTRVTAGNQIFVRHR